MRKTLIVASLIAVAMGSPVLAAGKANRISPKMPASQTQQVANPRFAFRCYTNNPSCSGNARFGGGEAMSIRILYNQGRGGQKNFTIDQGQVVTEPVRFNDVY